MYSLAMAEQLGIPHDLLRKTLDLFGEKYLKDEIIFAIEGHNLRFFFNKVESNEMSRVVDELSKAFSLGVIVLNFPEGKGRMLNVALPFLISNSLILNFLSPYFSNLSATSKHHAKNL